MEIITILWELFYHQDFLMIEHLPEEWLIVHLKSSKQNGADSLKEYSQNTFLKAFKVNINGTEVIQRN